MRRRGEVKYIYLYRMLLLLLLLAEVFILQGTRRVRIAYGATDEKEGIYFENDWVESGVPLKVLGASKASAYHWTITGPDGTKKSFITKDNTYTPVNEDLEKLITVTADSDGSNSVCIYYSNLPVIYIENSQGYYGVGDLFSDAAMHMQGNNKFPDKNELYDGNINIKLRGNSTKLCEKRPFHISLDQKADLMGMGKNKHWTLLANYIDHTLMRNKLLYDFSGAIGMDTYCKSENVVLIFNKEYYGVYQLCESVDIGSNRVDIKDWEESAEDAADAIVDELANNGKLQKTNKESAAKRLETAMCRDLSWITKPYTFTYDVDEDGKEETYQITDYISLSDATGGALLEMDFYNFQGNNASSMITNYSQPLYFKEPEYAATNHNLYQYINQYVQSFEYALHSTDFFYHDVSIKYNALNRSGGNLDEGYDISDFSAPEFDGLHYSELFDMDSLVQNFIVCELAMNWDGMKNSVFLYKDTDGLFKMGPEWDFDWAWGNINMYNKNTWYPTSWQTTEEDFVKEQYYQTVQWNRCLIRDPYFIVRAYEKYKEIRETLIEDMIKDGGTIDTYAKELKTAAAANDRKWCDTYEHYHSVGFDASVRNMKEFIRTRIDWMDQQCESIDTMIKSLGYYVTDDELRVIKVEPEMKKGYTIITAIVSGTDISSIAFQINGTKIYNAKVTSGKVVCRIPNSDLMKDKDIHNIVQISALDENGNYIISSENEGNYAMAKSNYAVFYTGGRMIIEKSVISLYLWIILAFIIISGIGFGIYITIGNKRSRKHKSVY